MTDLGWWVFTAYTLGVFGTWLPAARWLFENDTLGTPSVSDRVGSVFGGLLISLTWIVFAPALFVYSRLERPSK